MQSVKQVIVVPSTVTMSPGKLAAQVAHAAIGAFERARPEDIARWQEFGVTKVVLRCVDELELFRLVTLAHERKLPYFVVCDAGRTEIPEGTITALGIGPASASVINQVTGTLPLY